MGAWIMAGVTFREAGRKKMIWMALLAGLAFLALFGASLHFQVKDWGGGKLTLMQRAQLNAMLLAGLYVLNLMTMAMTILASVDTLSGEIASGTIHVVATKPLPRWQVLIGKWCGFAGMLVLYIAIMVAGLSFLTWLLSGYQAPHLLRGCALIGLESLLLLTMTFLVGTTFSTLTNGVVVLGLYGLAFLGGWIEQFGALANSPRALNLGIAASVVMPSEALWRRAAFEMQSPLVGAMGFTPFSNASVPSAAMVVYAGLYLALALLLAIRRFAQRDL